MNTRRFACAASRIALALLLPLVAAAPALAVRVPERTKGDALAFRSEIFDVHSDVVQDRALPSTSALAQGWAGLRAAHPGNWEVMISRYNGMPLDAMTDGIPVYPGSLNRLSSAQAQAPTLAGLDGFVRDLVLRHPDVFGVPEEDLVLNKTSSMSYDDGAKWLLAYDVTYRGLPVRQGRYTFKFGGGNLVSFGAERLPRHNEQTLTVTPNLDRAAAIDAVRKYIGYDPATDHFLTPGALVVTGARRIGSEGAGTAPGSGYEYRLVWEIELARSTELRGWMVWVDAQTGEILKYENEGIQFAQVKAGVYIKGNDLNCATGGCETEFPMPFADVYNRTAIASSAGIYNFTTATASTLNHLGITGNQHLRVFSNQNFVSFPNPTVPALCTAAISEPSVAGTGLIDFGRKNNLTDIDCAFPTGHSAGSTGAARASFYWVNREKQTCRTYQPTNASCNGTTLTNIYVNMDDVCNAFRSGNNLVMYSDKGSTCRNTGENTTIVTHEVGHLIDATDGSGGNRPIEAYADIVGGLLIQESCIGRGFDKAGNCAGYGDACLSCSGIRDIDWRKHANNTPHHGLNYLTGGRCAGGNYFGPCNTEDHCESVIASEAVWDAFVFDIPAQYGMSLETSFALGTRLFWQSGPGMATNMYTCNTTTFATDGCANTSLYKQILFFDDCDGNIANGTQHMTAINTAFARHNLACATPAVVDQTSCCVTPGAVNNLATVSNPTTIGLTWTAAANATQYRIMKNDAGCPLTFNIIATVNAATVCAGSNCAYTDSDVLACTNYYYKLQPISSGTCEGPVSNCASGAAGSVSPPTGLTTSNPSANVVRVSWNPVGGATGYNVYKAARATCAQQPFYQFLATVAGTFYDDTAVSGSDTNSYVVRTTTATCESGYSSCVQGTATGPCLRAPTFCDPASTSKNHRCAIAENTGANPAGIRVRWFYPAVTDCSTAPNMRFNVYRGSAPGFPKDGTTRIASGLNVMEYLDSAVTCGNTYYYTVRAEDNVGGGGSGPNGGIEETNNWEFQQAAWTETIIYSDNFETSAIPANWTVTGTATAGQWVIADPDHASYAGEVGTMTDDVSYVGTRALTTGTNPTGENCCNDVDGGTTTVSSTANINGTSALPNVWVSYWRNYHEIETTETTDSFVSAMSTNGGGAYTTLETALTRSMPYRYFAQNITGQNNATMRFRFSGTDAGTGGHAEATVDDLRIYSRSCPVACVAPSGLTNNTAADASLCADSGVNVAWTQDALNWGDGGIGTRTYTVLRDGVAIGAGGCSGAIAYGTTTCNDNSGTNGVTYTYSVRYNNGCGSNATTAGATASDVNNTPTPTISGANANVCPSTTVALSTQGGMTGYQWYIGGSPIGGANSSTYNATATGSYTVSYVQNGCTGTSATHSVTITPCTPNVVYQSNSALTQVCGDGDAIVEPGEQWSVTVTLANTGAATATNTAASLTLNGGSVVSATISGNPGAYGNIAPAGTANNTFTFTVSQSAVCVNNITFDVTAISSTEGAYPSQIPAFTVQVGTSVTENATQVTTPLNASSGAATSSFTPAFTLTSATSASVGYNLAYSGGGVTETANQTITPLIAQNNIVTTTMTPGFTIAGGSATSANISWTLAGNTDLTACVGIRLRAPDTTELVLKATGAANPGSANVLAFYQAEGPGTYVLVLEELTGCGQNAMRTANLTATSMVVQAGGSGTATANVQVELIDPSATATVLKAFGAANASPYNVTALYTGAGTYQLRVTENAGGTATITAGTMSATRTQCDVSGCGFPGLITGETWGGTKNAWSWAAEANSTGYRVYRGTQADLPNLLNGGLDACERWSGAPVTTGPILTEDPSALPGRFYWYITIGTNGLGDGPSGNATAGPRQVNSTGVCP